MDEKVVCRDFRHTTQHGAIKDKEQETTVKYYNLRAITAVGYRVNSQRAIEFRKWATEILHEYTFQANHLKLRFKTEDKKTQLAHTLNGSVMALPRIIAAMLENYQTDEGVVIPEVLHPYLNFTMID